MPVNPEALASRYSKANYPIHKYFCSFFVSGVVGIRHFDRNKCHLEFSKYVSISDEAFTVLTLESNWSIYVEFEKYCMEEFQEEAEAQGKNQNKRKKREPDKPLPVACNELWDDDENVGDNVDEQEEGTSRLPPGLGGLIGV